MVDDGFDGGGIVKVPVGLVGCEVRRTAFDYQVRLSLANGDAGERNNVDVELVVETPFLLRAESGVWHEVDPGTVDTLAPVLRLFMRKVESVEVGGSGALSVEFDNGVGLFVEPDTTYESWSLSGRGVQPVVVGPGGHYDWQR
jgi:hypothetical protein